MSQMFRLCVVGSVIAIVGCGGSKPELGPAKEAPKVDQADMQKKMMESYEKMKASGQNPAAPPGTPKNQ